MRNLLIILLLSIHFQLQAFGKEAHSFPGHASIINVDTTTAKKVDASEFFTVQISTSHGVLIIEVTANFKKNTGIYEIYNIFGKRLLNGRIKEKITTLSIKDLPKGIYIAHVVIDKKQSSKKFIVK